MIQLLDQKLVSDLENLTKPQPVEPPTTKDSTEQEKEEKQEEKEEKEQQQQQQTSEQEDIDKDVIMKDVDDTKQQQQQQQQQQEQQQQVMLSPEEIADETAYLQKKHQQDVEILKSIFKQVTSSSSSKELPENIMPKKQVPEYLQDPISFNLFVDPVITKSGQTYERSWILEHLRTHNTEPFSRQLLTEKDLVPNLAIKEAAEEFIKQEGEY